MVTFADMDIQNYTVEVPADDLDSTKLNMADERLDIIIGFLPPGDTVTPEIPGPDIATVKVFIRSMTEYYLNNSTELELEPCS